MSMVASYRKIESILHISLVVPLFFFKNSSLVNNKLHNQIFCSHPALIGKNHPAPIISSITSKMMQKRVKILTALLEKMHKNLQKPNYPTKNNLSNETIA